MISFNEEKHEYTLDGKVLISVTQLMKKHGLSPNYGEVPAAILRAKAERGTLIHKEIEDFIKNGEIGFTTEMLNFRKYVETQNIKVLASEIIVYNDIVAGTVDLLLDGEVIADIKTTATLHQDAISWQLSIYNFLLDNKFTKGQVYHFDKDGNLNVVDIPLKPVEEVGKLLECEKNGVLYRPPAIVSDSQLMQIVELETIIKHYDEQKKQAEKQAQELRDALLEAMEQNGVKTMENERIRITYTAPTTRQSVDSALLKKEQPSIYEQYLKTSNVKAKLTITLKEEA